MTNTQEFMLKQLRLVLDRSENRNAETRLLFLNNVIQALKAGQPINDEIIKQICRVWRDGDQMFGQIAKNECKEMFKFEAWEEVLIKYPELGEEKKQTMDSSVGEQGGGWSLNVCLHLPLALNTLETLASLF